MEMEDRKHHNRLILDGEVDAAREAMDQTPTNTGFYRGELCGTCRDTTDQVWT